jgi:hypothetical protein
VPLLSWISLMYVLCVFVQYAAVYHYCRFVCVWSSCPGEISDLIAFWLVLLGPFVVYVLCPSHLILCALMNLTISALSINLSISLLFRSRHTYKPTVVTYGCILYKHTTNIHPRNST